MTRCCVPQCGNHQIRRKQNKIQEEDKNQENLSESHRISFHHFPTDNKQRSKWLRFLGQDLDLDTTNMFICSEHFSAEQFRDANGEPLRKRLKLDGEHFRT